MKLNTFELENFRTINGHFTVPLSPDGKLYLIDASNNGKGKTSILYAFYFLLCGTTVDVIESYRNWDTEEPMKLHINLDFKGINFDIKYSYDGKTSDKELVIDNGKPITGVTSVNKKLKEFFDPSLIVPATALFESDKNIIKLKPSERREMLKKIYDIDFSKRIKELEVEAKTIADSLQAKEKELLVLKSKDFKDEDLVPYPETFSFYDDYKLQVAEKEKNLSTLATQLSSIEDTKRNLEKLQSEYNENDIALKNIVRDIEDSSEAITKYEAYKKDEFIITNLQGQYDAIKLERIKPFDDSILTNKQQELSNINADIRIKTVELADCKSGVCPKCHKDYDSHDVETTEKEIVALKEKRVTIESEIQTLKSAKDEYDKLVKENETKKHNRELLLQKIEAEKNRLTQEEATNTRSLEKEKQTLARLEESKKATEVKNMSLATQITAIEIPDSEAITQKIALIENEISPLKDAILRIDTIRITNDLIVRRNKEKVLLKKENEKAIEILNTEILDLQGKEHVYSLMKDFLRKEFPSYVISSTIKEIQNSMNSFINKVYYKTLDVKINADDDKIDIKYGEGKRQVDCVNASGAEAALLSISFAYALNKVNNYGIFFLDEIDAPMSLENATKLCDMVAGMQDFFETIFVISHVDSVKEKYTGEYGAETIYMG